MARLNNTLLPQGGGANPQASHTIVDLRQGGQNGFMTDPASYVSNANYVRRNLIPVLMEAPVGFNDLPNPDYWIGSLKALVELHAQTIEGLTSTLTVEFAETPVGGAGEMQEDVVNVTRARSVVSMGFPEKWGKAVNGYFDGWINYLLGDPETKVPWVTQLTGNAPADFLPDYQAMTMMFIEPDITHKHVVEAWIVANMMPKTGGTNEGRREIAAAGETLIQTIEFTGRTETGNGVRSVAQEYLDSLSLTGSNPNNRPAHIQAVHPDIVAAATGYSDQMANASSTFL